MDYLSNLPDEVLIEILSYCAVRPLTLVCKRFNNIIGSSLQLMETLYLAITDKATMSEVVKSERRYQGVRFYSNSKIEEDCLNLLSAFHGLKLLEFQNCRMPAELFVAMLERLKNIEATEVSCMKLNGAEQLSTLKAPQMAKLKTLELWILDDNEKVLDILNEANLENLSLYYSPKVISSNLIDFLRSQKSLKKLNLGMISSINGVLLSIILQEMDSLETLILHLVDLDRKSTRDLEISNTTVTNLTLINTTGFADDFRIFLNIFKSVKNLKLESSIEVRVIQPSLESISLIDCNEIDLNLLELPRLKRLEIGNFFEPPPRGSPYSLQLNQWQMSASLSSLINTIVIHDESITNETFARICYELKHLQHFETFYDLDKLTSSIFDVICDPSFPRNIRLLKFRQTTQRIRLRVYYVRMLDPSEEHKLILHAKTWLKCIIN